MSQSLPSLAVLPGSFVVCRLEPRAPTPAWATGGTFFSVSRTPEELSVVCDERYVPDGTVAERDWSCLQVIGPLAFSEVGLLANLAGALASAGVSIFVVSTYDTDYLLVRESRLEQAVGALSEAGHIVHRWDHPTSRTG